MAAWQTLCVNRTHAAVAQKLETKICRPSVLPTDAVVTHGAAPVSFETSDQPLTPGVTLLREGTRFVVHSRHASAVDLCLYDPDDPARETARVRMKRGECDLWHATVRAARPGHAVRLPRARPVAAAECDALQRKKLLLDPYARAIHGVPDAAEHMHTVPGSAARPGLRRQRSQGLKCVVIDESFDWTGDIAPPVPWHDTVICEMHVKGFTQTHPDVPAKLRGTYAGLAIPPSPATCAISASPACNCCRCISISTTAFCSAAVSPTTGATTRSASFAPHNTYAAAAIRRSRCASSKRW
jgi:isoamylase